MTSQDENGSNCISSNKRDEESIKVRKPYTITKQRERWTEEEHTKFLDALKQYGRAWRRIEEHVGTKTAVQIRSHAQKFFSKVERESNGDDLKSVEPIEIPPPRPKRKPMHPYPRKLVIITPVCVPEKPTRSVSPTEKESQSPTSVLFALDSEAQASADSSPNASPSCVSSVTEASTGRYLKLFGKTVLVNEYPMTMDSINPVIPSLPWGLRCAPVQVHSPVPIKARRLSFDSKDGEEIEDVKEGSSTCSNSDSSSSSFKPTKIVMLKRKSAGSTKRTKGFLPYKRCLAERAIHSQTIASEEMEKQRTRLCL